MCSVEPDELVEMTKVSKIIDLKTSKCRKCDSSEVAIVLKHSEPYCRSCYLVYFVHKFRSTIGKSKQIKAGDKVLVCVSGGMSSSALIHLIHEGLSDNSVKRLRFVPTFLLVDENALHPDSEMDETRRINNICSTIKSYGYECYVTNFEEVMSCGTINVVQYDKNYQRLHTEKMDENISAMKKLVAQCGSISTKQDVLFRLRLKIICQAAVALNFSKVFLGDNATTLAVRILSNVAQGRGSHISNDVHFKSVHEEVEFYRPLREALEEEVSHYVQLYNIFYDTSSHLQREELGITSCTKKFIVNLQKDFPATIPTVFRTGDKLIDGNIPSEESLDADDVDCIFCGNSKDTNKPEASAMYATILSQKLSSTKIDNELRLPSEESITESNGVAESSCGKASCNCGSEKNNSLSKEDMFSFLCYSCRIILRELNAVESLPENVRLVAQKKLQRSAMKEEISNFLL